MIKIEKTEVWGFEHAVRGMRNPLNSWWKSDSVICPDSLGFEDCHDGLDGKCPRTGNNSDEKMFCLGENDRQLMEKLIKGGQPHRKFLRQIFVSVDITAPFYWWKEFDTYKVGTTANSCSTMHKIAAKEFTLDDFSMEHLSEDVIENPVKSIIKCLNFFRDSYNLNHDKDDWWQMIQLLPSSYNQKRTVTMTYENLLNMLEYRRGHKLDEWREFCDWILSLPYGELLKEGLE